MSEIFMSLFSFGYWQDHNGDVIVEFPDIDPKRSLFQIRPRQSLGQQILGHPQHIWYSPQDAAVALQYLLSSADALGLSKPYRLAFNQKSS